ncbi:MAG TPA: LptF/LptG family permease [Bryobacteraceae bacterium]|nr:LptF/LptG family permease [Bryobacteraceae bacterium]
MLRILSRYVFREIVTSALLGTLLATFVIFLHGVGTLFELLVGAGNQGVHTILMLFALAMPPVLPTTIPFGVLVGILIGLGRMASDGEIIAMRAAGVSARRVIAPVLMFAALGTALAGFASLRLTPLSIRKSTEIINDLIKSQLSAEIQEHVFDEDFPDKILYVGAVRPGPTVLWSHVFLADVTPPERRSAGMGAKADGPLITVAHEAIAISDPKNNRIQLNLRDFATHEMGKDGKAQDVSSPRGDQALYASPPEERTTKSSAMNTAELLRRRSGPDWLEVQIELHRRFSLPLACIMLALVGIPLGISTRKGGKSAGYIVALFLGFFCYHLASVALVGVAKQRTLPIPVAIWLPDAAFGLAGLVFLFRMEQPGDRDLMTAPRRLLGRLAHVFKSKVEPVGGARLMAWRLPLLPQIVDTYILSSFLFYVTVVLASFVSMSQVYFFFELVGDMIRNNITLVKMFTYLFFLTPQLIYSTLPVSILMAVLILFGVMSKQNEVTAFKACGVSVFRLCAPILIGSTLFCGGLFAFDYYYVPGANRIQDALRDEIKGRKNQTYLRPDRKWIMGQGSRIYYYEYFDTSERTMMGVDVFELEPDTFRLVRQILAERARWSPSIKTWVFENGWFSDFKDANDRSYHAISATTFPELTEPPDYFHTAALKDEQMNVQELKQYIRDLHQRGFPTTKLQVQLYRKYSVPLFALIMAMIAAPFGFLMGNKGAMTGIGVSMAIGVAYLAIDPLFQKLGEFSELPPAMAAWSPDVLFSLTGLYLLLRMRS